MNLSSRIIKDQNPVFAHLQEVGKIRSEIERRWVLSISGKCNGGWLVVEHVWDGIYGTYVAYEVVE